MNKVFSFDAETDGLWGQPFAIAAIVYERKTTVIPAHRTKFGGALMQARYGPGSNIEPGPDDYMDVPETMESKWVETARFISRLPNSFVSNEWVKENVLPTIADVAITHNIYEEMLKDFAAFYLANKAESDVICHMGFPVEAHLLREMHRLGFIGDWDGPFPLIDLAGNLKQVCENPTSVDEYAKKHGLKVADYGTTHNPLYDCEVAAQVYLHLNKK